MTSTTARDWVWGPDSQQISPEERLWRSQMFVEAESDDSFICMLPGWDVDDEFEVRRSDAPAGMRAGERLYVMANIGCSCVEDLRIQFDGCNPIRVGIPD